MKTANFSWASSTNYFLLLFMLFGLLFVKNAQAVTGNFVSDFQHPYVALVALYGADGITYGGRCTGTAVTPHMVLTAGHCVRALGGGGGYPKAVVIFDQNASPSPGRLGSANTYANLCNTTDSNGNLNYSQCYMSDPNIPNERIDPFLTDPTNDVAIIILKDPFPGPYARLANAGSLEAISKFYKGDNSKIFLTASGYGIIDVHPSVDSGNIERLEATQKVIDASSGITTTYVKASGSKGNDQGGTCGGDSGGPHFYGDFRNSVYPPDVILALTSYGPQNCSGAEYDQRIDLKPILDRIIARTPIGEQVKIVSFPFPSH